MRPFFDQQIWKKVTLVIDWRGTVSWLSAVFRLVVSFSILLVLFPYDSVSAGMVPGQSYLPSAPIAALQSTPFKERSATLIGPREDAPIALYIRPAPNQQPVGYGISGDPVTITDQFGDYLMGDDPSATWSHVRLNNPPYTEGWLRGRFLSADSPADAVDLETSEERLTSE